MVDDIVFRTHRCLPETELEDRGPRASNQLSKLEGLLKNSPKKLSLSRAGHTLEEIPSLGVVVEELVNHSHSARYLQAFLVFSQHPACFITPVNP